MSAVILSEAGRILTGAVEGPAFLSCSFAAMLGISEPAVSEIEDLLTSEAWESTNLSKLGHRVQELWMPVLRAASPREGRETKNLSQPNFVPQPS